MIRTSKLSPAITKRIGENIALGLTYALAAEAGDTRICMWVLERRFMDDFGRRVYRKMNVVSDNKNENIEITVKEADVLRKEILAKLDRF